MSKKTTPDPKTIVDLTAARALAERWAASTPREVLEAFGGTSAAFVAVLTLSRAVLALTGPVAADARPETPLPWRAGDGYEQSERGNYIAGANGAIVCAEQDDTDCTLSTEDRDYIIAACNAFPGLAAALHAATLRASYADGRWLRADEERDEAIASRDRAVQGLDQAVAVREGLEADVARLTEEIAGWEAAQKMLVADVDRARAQRDKAEAEVERLGAEVETLTRGS